ncbi:uracil-DNA glycosylase family protein [Ochrovirga pacifica]|uniref:uracil-DNA glycosylase family protein n=1 Tax=Ochrovirga pacifica TaxID=1042376 RepID=UPI0002557F5B|nr:uracil-DNA glycosylase family protein [Ochrovirga pacifica]
MQQLLDQIKNCTLCQPFLEHRVRPVIEASTQSKIAIIGQAPGTVVHRTGIPWNDKSGERLRSWLGVDHNTFYNKEIFAIVPMGFCYPGKGKTGDLPPRKECAPAWHPQVFNQLKQIELMILIGAYAQNYYLKQPEKTLTATVKNFHNYWPNFLVLPHPSPRNNIWLKRNDWFEKQNLPFIQKRIQQIINP